MCPELHCDGEHMPEVGTERVGCLEVSLGVAAVIIRGEGGTVSVIPEDNWEGICQAVSKLKARKTEDAKKKQQ